MLSTPTLRQPLTLALRPTTGACVVKLFLVVAVFRSLYVGVTLMILNDPMRVLQRWGVYGVYKGYNSQVER